MDVIQRGNPGIMRSIQQKAKKISESNGNASIGEPSVPSPAKPAVYESQGGAYASMQRRQALDAVSTEPVMKRPQITERSVSSVGSVKLLDRLMESVETLPYNKEYFNATSSLFTLYSMGELTEGVLRGLSREDLKEIRGIIREFKETLEAY